MELSVTSHGTPHGRPPVLLTHGLFGQGRNLGVIARSLSHGRQVLSVDLRNHGESAHDPDQSYDALAADLAQVIDAHGGQADVVAHSMGGKAAMWLALNHPQTIRRLVVLDIAPVAYRHSQSRYIDAMEAMDLSGLITRAEADRRLSALVPEPGVRAFLLQSLDLRADPPRWKLNLPVLRAAMPDLVGWPGHKGKSWPGPVLLLAGAEGDYVTAEGEAAMRAAFPHVVIEHIAGTGHWLHADRPAEVAGRVARFLDG